MPQLSPRSRRNLIRILPFGIIWLLSGLVFLIVEYAVLGSQNSPSSTAIQRDFIQMDYKIFLFGNLAQTAVGFLVGGIELAYLANAFEKKSFSQKIFYKFLIYLLFFSVIIFFTYPFAASMEMDTHLLDGRVWKKYGSYLSSSSHLSTLVQLGVALLASLFYAEIGQNMGHKVLLDYFSGKYHKPVEEDRIFMFLDMKSSTQIAEKLGHIRYFSMLKDYYADLSDPIITYAGEIYQYVGDEIVISWPLRTGVKDLNCIRSFFAMKTALQDKADGYKGRYGLVPTFKAGLHTGKVTTGEIGVIKKEIIFTGDILNATARIQGLCNFHNAEILLSGDLLKQLDLKNSFEIRSIGKQELRGKQANLELYSLSPL